MSDTPQTLEELISRMLATLGVKNSAQRESMIQELNQFIQIRAGQIMLLGLPEATQKEFSQLSEAALLQAFLKRFPEPTVKAAVEQAVAETIPGYVAAITKAAASN